MFYKEIIEPKGAGVQFWKNLLLSANHMVALWVQCIYQPAKRNSGYVTGRLQKKSTELKNGYILGFIRTP